MDNLVKYVFGILAVIMFFAAVITFLERVTDQDEMSYAIPLFLFFIGSGLGVFAWIFNPVGAIDDSDSESTDADDSEATACVAIREEND